MAHVVYEGPFDKRELSAADWKSLGVEDASKTVFERHESYEVDDSVLGVLLELGGFKELSDKEVAKLLGEDASDEETPDTSSKQTGLDTAGTGTTTTATGRGGRGRSGGNTSTAGS